MNKKYILGILALIIIISVFYILNFNQKDDVVDLSNLDTIGSSTDDSPENNQDLIKNNIESKKIDEIKNTPTINQNSNSSPTSSNSTTTNTVTTKPKVSTGIVKEDTGDLDKKITAHEWYWIKTEKGIRPISPDTEVVTPKNQTDFVLSFTRDGIVNIKTDCNSMSGNYKLDGIKLTFGPMISTQKYCDGSVEEQFSESIKSGITYYLSFDNTGDKMYIVSNGTMYFIKK